MKFGKKILSAANASESLCEVGCWLDYKALKKLLKAGASPAGKAGRSGEAGRSGGAAAGNSARGGGSTAAAATSDSLTRIRSNAEERRFFLALKQELYKVTTVYLELERRALGDLLSLCVPMRKRLRAAAVDSLPVEADDLERLLAVHGRLLLLRNFAVLNYVGFTKILKKHDKVTGFETRDKYMLKMVNDQPFAQHSPLQAGLAHANAELASVRRCGKMVPGDHLALFMELTRIVQDPTSSLNRHARARSCSTSSAAHACPAAAAATTPAVDGAGTRAAEPKRKTETNSAHSPGVDSAAAAAAGAGQRDHKRQKRAHAAADRAANLAVSNRAFNQVLAESDVTEPAHMHPLATLVAAAAAAEPGR